MQFQVNREEYYPILVQRLKSFVVDFKTEFDEDDGPYLILADLNKYIIQNIDKSEVIHKCANFINEAISLGKDKTKNAIIFEIFQPIHKYAKAANIFRTYLSYEALELFDDDESQAGARV